MTTPTTGRGYRDSSGTPSLLLDLINNTADPGYAAAAARRGESNHSWYEQPLAALGAALVGLILVIAYLHAHRAAPQTAKLHAELVKRVRAAQLMNDSLQHDLLGDQAKLNALRDKSLPAAGQLRSTLQSDQLAAGALTTFGTGMQVQLAVTAAPTATQAARVGVTTVTDTSPLSDKDIRSVVNELWHDGAEAISVNDIRLTPTSAIRFAGQAVLVDFQPITSPYVIRAIGDSDVLVTNFADSEVASRYHTLAALGGITFDWSQQNHLELPAGSAAKPNYAAPVTPGAAANGSPKPTPSPQPTVSPKPTPAPTSSSPTGGPR
ncbi:uncharacterized protein DUF881 [Jatrophihabitans sp. GAS493]|uniref:DUF881 domain-containing protein n=1 Tax=Jatrophihabitans sp. GAS493 TaxID=1907575 RepID=UPI000BBF7240|nr:DUF881 domain-containing protein [Jatrophihabitans sp. GAS493]SOD73815.1 uncharacterized protein DUF881 [Jatrophihabitans sp. GAS493]